MKKRHIYQVGIFLAILICASCAKETVQFAVETPLLNSIAVMVEDTRESPNTLESIATPIPSSTHTLTASETPLPTETTKVVVPEICEGSGSGICEIPKFIERELFYVEATYSGASDFVVWVVDSQGNQLASIFEETGDYQGTRLFPRFWLGEEVGDLDVANLVVDQGDGAWVIEVNSINNTFADMIRDLNQQVTGTGDYVIITYGTSAPCTFSCDAPGDFIVRTISTESEVTQLINETGPYTGTFLLPDVIIIEITCPGNWSISPE
jgi:hypothetical protein